MASTSIYKHFGAFALITALFLSLAPSGYGSSSLQTGKMKELNPVDGRDKDRGYCYFFTGPHGDFLEAGQFLLLIADDEFADGNELELLGTFETSGNKRFKLSPNEESTLALQKNGS